MSQQLHPFKLLSLLLQYPDGEIRGELASLDLGQVEPATSSQRELLRGFLSWYLSLPLDHLRRAYVDDFDFDRRRSLHLTYQLHGDSRQRGLALLKIKTTYRAHGLVADDGELPDYLPLMLEFAALVPARDGIALLDRHRESIELVGESLRAAGSPWTPLFDLIGSAMPGLTSRQVNRIRRLAKEGPPTEEVGLEPFAPPEVMPARAGEVPLPLIGGDR